MTITLQLDHVSIFVRDRDASARFYGEVLGLPEVENKTGRPHIRWFGLGAGRSIHLISGASEEQMKRPRSTHFALATSEFGPMLKRLRDAGVRYEALSGVAHEVSVRFDGVRQVYFPPGRPLDRDQRRASGRMTRA